MLGHPKVGLITFLVFCPIFLIFASEIPQKWVKYKKYNKNLVLALGVQSSKLFYIQEPVDPLSNLRNPENSICNRFIDPISSQKKEIVVGVVVVVMAVEFRSLRQHMLKSQSPHILQALSLSHTHTQTHTHTS